MAVMFETDSVPPQLHTGNVMAAPPPTAYTLEERDQAIRRERAKRLPKQPDHTPLERAALRVWEEKVVHDRMLEQLNDELDHQSKRLSEPPDSKDVSYTWKKDVRIREPRRHTCALETCCTASEHA